LKFLITCQFGLSSILTSEIKRLGYKPFDTFPTGTYVEWDEKAMMQINLRSRVANKVFVQMWSQKVFSFDELFDFVHGLEWDKYLSNQDISISVHFKNSQLQSQKSIQSICHKAILKKLWTASLSRSQNQKDIFVHIENDMAKIFLNTSGKSLHNRGRRTEVWEAPIKENIAAGLVLLGGWKFQEPLWDPFCGSGTICIEAAMIAKNMAPGLQRDFAFEEFPGFQKTMLEELKNQARERIFDKKYKILGTDIDPRNIVIAEQNAQNAWVKDSILFQKKDYLDAKPRQDETIISNPPYGERIKVSNIEELYRKLVTDFGDGCTGGFITSYLMQDIIPNKKQRNTKQINNNGEMCTLWRKKV